ncbi:MAG: hypothetical protein ACRDRI_24510 [Pseudonocardiaceae bacterium]
MGRKTSHAAKVPPTSGGRANNAGKRIAAKLVVFVATTGSVFALSITPATANAPEETMLDARVPDRDTLLTVIGDHNDWTVNGSWNNSCSTCQSHRFPGHIEVITPDGSHINGPDSDNPKSPDVHGTGDGKVTVIGYKLVSPGNYEIVGAPSAHIS